jgi:hypothetical protein
MHCCYISLQFFNFFIYSMVTYYPILFIVWLLIALFFTQYYIVRELFKVFVVFYNKFVFTNCVVLSVVRDVYRIRFLSRSNEVRTQVTTLQPYSLPPSTCNTTPSPLPKHASTHTHRQLYYARLYQSSPRTICAMTVIWCFPSRCV